MPDQKSDKTEPARRPNLRDNYRKLGIPAVVAAVTPGRRDGRDRSRGDQEPGRPDRN